MPKIPASKLKQENAPKLKHSLMCFRHKKKFLNQWIFLEDLLELLKQYAQLPSAFTVITFTRALSSINSYLDNLQVPNEFGLFQQRKRIDGRRRIGFFFIKNVNKTININLSQHKYWYNNCLNTCKPRTEITPNTMDDVIMKPTEETPTVAKNTRIPRIEATPIDLTTHLDDLSPQQPSLKEATKSYSRLESSDSSILFTNVGLKLKKPKKDDQVERVDVLVGVRNTICEMIRNLIVATRTSQGWKEIVENADDHEHCTNNDIFIIREKARYLESVYRSKPIAMKKTKKNFRDLVDLVTSRDVLTVAAVRKSSK